MTGRVQVCTAEGCDQKPSARRLCRRHYQQAWKAGELDQHRKTEPRKRDRKVCPPDHKHAEKSTCFIQHQCRCEPCRVAHNERERTRHRLKAYGRWDTGLVDAAPVRDHVLALSEFGIGYKRVAELAGVGVTGVRTLIWGRQDPGPRFGEIPKRIGRDKARKILAVQPTLENLGGSAKVPATGTHRRAQALVARGWTLTALADRMGMEVGNFWGLLHRSSVLADSHRRMAAIFDELWDVEPPASTPREKGARTRSVNYAQRRGWLPPLAWDDIDTDPEPDTTVVEQGCASADEVLDEVEFLLDAGESPEQVAAAVGRKFAALAKLAERNGRVEIAQVFWRVEKGRPAA